MVAKLTAPVIQVSDLSKFHKIYNKPSDMLREIIVGGELHRKFWALREISFSISKGEILGILGRNGAGKSTLLKIIAGTLEKSLGELEVNGKISSILELGTGFHPEYTGRENIVMGGLCLGMSRSEIESKVESIIDFSEIRQFIDQPFKTYSTGMQARLTFSTAISVQPDILIVDEALAVGDMLFQEKCIRRMREICAAGCTVLFVTHSLQYIYEFCTRCLLLHESKLVLDGAPRVVGEQYERLLAEERNSSRMNGNAAQTTSFPALTERGSSISDSCKERDLEVTQASKPEVDQLPEWRVELDSLPGVPEGQEAGIVAMQLFGPDLQPTSTLDFGKRYTLAIAVRFTVGGGSIDIGFKFQKDTGVAVIGDTTKEAGISITSRADSTVAAYFTFDCRLYPGAYLIGAGCTKLDSQGGFTILDQQLGRLLVTVSSIKLLNGLVDPDCVVRVAPMMSELRREG